MTTEISEIVSLHNYGEISTSLEWSEKSTANGNKMFELLTERQDLTGSDTGWGQSQLNQDCAISTMKNNVHSHFAREREHVTNDPIKMEGQVDSVAPTMTSEEQNLVSDSGSNQDHPQEITEGAEEKPVTRDLKAESGDLPSNLIEDNQGQLDLSRSQNISENVTEAVIEENLKMEELTENLNVAPIAQDNDQEISKGAESTKVSEPEIEMATVEEGNLNDTMNESSMSQETVANVGGEILNGVNNSDQTEERTENLIGLEVDQNRKVRVTFEDSDKEEMEENLNVEEIAQELVEEILNHSIIKEMIEKMEEEAEISVLQEEPVIEDVNSLNVEEMVEKFESQEPTPQVNEDSQIEEMAENSNLQSPVPVDQGVVKEDCEPEVSVLSPEQVVNREEMTSGVIEGTPDSESGEPVVTKDQEILHEQMTENCGSQEIPVVKETENFGSNNLVTDVPEPASGLKDATTNSDPHEPISKEEENVNVETVQNSGSQMTNVDDQTLKFEEENLKIEEIAPNSGPQGSVTKTDERNAIVESPEEVTEKSNIEEMPGSQTVNPIQESSGIEIVTQDCGSAESKVTLKEENETPEQIADSGLHEKLAEMNENKSESKDGAEVIKVEELTKDSESKTMDETVKDTVDDASSSDITKIVTTTKVKGSTENEKENLTVLIRNFTARAQRYGLNVIVDTQNVPNEDGSGSSKKVITINFEGTLQPGQNVDRIVRELMLTMPKLTDTKITKSRTVT